MFDWLADCQTYMCAICLQDAMEFYYKSNLTGGLM